ncbi:MAG: alpha/beta hydrolase [Candidatus Methanoplasma sp.]|nr:alpha/beta hydrolase [Candidatus Methanoplasma sp.]
MPYVNVNGANMYYEMDGNGPPVILLTGFGGDINFWKKALDIMSEEYTVIRIDNRGVGKTSYEGQFTLDDIADDIICLTDELGLEKFSIVGWSMGSHAAYKVAETVPDRVSSLTLVSSYRWRPARTMYMLSSALCAVEDGAPMDCLGSMINGLCNTDEFFDEKERAGEDIRPPSLRNPVGLRHQLNAVGMSRLDGPIDVPSLVIHGDRDFMIDWSEGMKFKEIIPDCRILLIKGAGHLIPQESYIPAVMDFIGEHQG